MVNILKMQLQRVPLRPVVQKGKRIIPCKTDVVNVLTCFAENGVDAAPCADAVLQLEACMEGFSEEVRAHNVPGVLLFTGFLSFV